MFELIYLIKINGIFNSTCLRSHRQADRSLCRVEKSVVSWRRCLVAQDWRNSSVCVLSRPWRWSRRRHRRLRCPPAAGRLRMAVAAAPICSGLQRSRLLVDSTMGLSNATSSMDERLSISDHYFALVSLKVRLVYQ